MINLLGTQIPETLIVGDSRRRRKTTLDQQRINRVIARHIPQPRTAISPSMGMSKGFMQRGVAEGKYSLPLTQTFHIGFTILKTVLSCCKALDVVIHDCFHAAGDGSEKRIIEEEFGFERGEIDHSR